MRSALQGSRPPFPREGVILQSFGHKVVHIVKEIRIPLTRLAGRLPLDADGDDISPAKDDGEREDGSK